MNVAGILVRNMGVKLNIKSKGNYFLRILKSFFKKK